MFEIGKKYTCSHISNLLYTPLYIGEKFTFIRIENFSTKLPLSETCILNTTFKDFQEYKEKKKGTFWVNIYNDGWGGVPQSSRRAADEHNNGHRIACVEIPWEEGQGLNVSS